MLKVLLKKIVSYNPRKETYNVIFEGSPDEYTVSVADIRQRTPQQMTKLERDFFNKK